MGVLFERAGMALDPSAELKDDMRGMSCKDLTTLNKYCELKDKTKMVTNKDLLEKICTAKTADEMSRILNRPDASQIPTPAGVECVCKQIRDKSECEGSYTSFE